MQRPLYAIAFLAAALTSQAQTAAPTVRQVGTARLENVPEIPPQVSAAVQRYQNDRAAIFEDWLSDGSMLIVTRFGASHQIHRVAAPGGARTQLTFSSEPVAAAFAIPKTERFAFMRDNGGDEWFQLYATGLTGEPTLLTEPGTRNEAPVFSDDGKLALWSLAYVSNEDGYSRVVVRDLATRRALSQPETPSGVVTGMRFSPDGSQLAISLSGAKIAGDVWSWSVADGKLTRWTTSELGGLDPAKLAEPQLMRFTSFDGMSIPAFVYRPVNVVADTRTPVIIDIHGGPEGQTRPSWNVGAQYFAATLGATVILPNVRGSDGYGQRYMDLDNAQKREDSVKDIGALLDWIAEQAGLDRNRVAVYGQSYGGYMSLAVMTHHADRLVGGVERYGISDFV
jgi:dipeptidyl aminopeptidase/acylaminoacyl peptidase